MRGQDGQTWGGTDSAPLLPVNSEFSRAQPWAPPQPPPPRRLHWLRLIVPLIVLALIGSITVAASNDKAQWDARLAPLAEFVAETRGLQFDHPVPVEFLTPEEWAETVAIDESGLSAEDRADGAEYAASLRAMGLIDGDVDLYDANNELAASVYVALFDPYEDRIQVLGEDTEQFDVVMQGTLVHELTHALQHQNFDLIALQEGADDGSALAISGLIEGDASATEADWAATLPDAEQDEYYSAYDELEDPGAAAPPGLAVAASAPYALGPWLANLLWASGDLDRAFSEPPSTEEHLLDPSSFIAGDVAERVPEPGLPAGAQRIEVSTQFGALGLFAMLAERIDPHLALAAADGWDGDAPVYYRQEERQCARVRFLPEDDAAKAVMLRALEGWASTFTKPFASVRDDERYVLFETCDPRRDAVSTGRAYPALALPALRANTMWAASEFTSDPEVIWCVADRIVEGMTITEINEFAPYADEASADAYSTRLAATAELCRAE
ncbi:MAG: hypothetical protein ABWZ15_15930 [Acidimicrobiia bacterium]